MKENFLLRFPHLGQSVFENLDDKNLVKCKEMSRSWSFYMDRERFFWKRIIKKLIYNYDDFHDAWNNALKEGDNKTIKELGLAVKRSLTINPLQISVSPLHLCAEFGLISPCRYLLLFLKDKNPKNKVHCAYNWHQP